VITERAAYGDLKDWFIDNKRGARIRLLTPTCVVYIAGELLSAVAHLHDHLDTLHRDIALRNLLFNSEGRVLLSDLGLARKVDQAYYKAPGSLVPILQPPEFNGKSTRATDMWMVGATVMELLLGRALQPREANDSKLVSHLLGHYVGSMPNLVRVVTSLLSPKPADRPTAVDALKELKGLYVPGDPSPCLPILVLHDFKSLSSEQLSRWLASIRPPKFDAAAAACLDKEVTGAMMVAALKEGTDSWKTFLLELGIQSSIDGLKVKTELEMLLDSS